MCFARIYYMCCMYSLVIFRVFIETCHVTIFIRYPIVDVTSCRLSVIVLFWIIRYCISNLKKMTYAPWQSCRLLLQSRFVLQYLHVSPIASILGAAAGISPPRCIPPCNCILCCSSCWLPFLKNTPTGCHKHAQLLLQGKYKEAQSLYERAIEILAATLGRHHPDVVAALDNLTALLREQVKRHFLPKGFFGTRVC